MSGDKIKAQFASSEQINPDLIQELNQTNAIVNIFVAMSTDPELKKLLDLSSIDIKKRASDLGAEKLIRDSIEMQQNILSGLNGAVSSISRCKVAFAMAQESLPTQAQVNDFKRKFESLKLKFLGKTRGLICSEAKEKFDEEVKGWLAILAHTQDQFVANMKFSLSRVLDKSKKWKDQYRETQRAPSRDSLNALRIALLREDGIKSSSSAEDICKNLMPDILPDATIGSSKNFVAGPMVIKHEHAEGLCHHEMGHKLFHFIENQNTCRDKSQFAKIRSCLLMNHSELTQEELLAESSKSALGDKTKYESEDWADLVSSMVDDNSNNVACLFARQMNNKNYANLSLRNSNDSDPHSSSLFRLLHLNFLKNGRISAQCEQALSARGEKANFKNCLNP